MGPRPGGDDHVLGLVGALAVGARDHHLVAATGAGLEAGGAENQLGAVGLEQLLNPAGELLDDARLPRLHLADIDARGLGHLDAHVLGMAQLVEGLGRVDQGLGRNAAHV